MRKMVIEHPEFYRILNKITEEYQDYEILSSQQEYDPPKGFGNIQGNREPTITINEIMKQNNIRARVVEVAISRDLTDVAIVFFDMMDYLRFV